MAGCLPEYGPVVLAAVEAMLLQPPFNLVGPSASLGGSAILVIANGPIVDELHINCRNNLFGPGNRANATIGRAVRLVLMNTCGAIPGLFDRTTLGHPGKYTYCIGEMPGKPVAAPACRTRLCPQANAVTVFACEGPRQVRNSLSQTPEGIATTIADVMSSLGTSMATSGSVGDTTTGTRQGEVTIVIAGEHMHTMARHGWTKADVRRYLATHARRTVADLKRGGGLPGTLQPGDAQQSIPIVAQADDILIVAAGGDEAP